MLMAVDRSNWPVMVRIGLWGLPSRGSAWAFVGLSFFLAIGCFVYGFVDFRFFYGSILVVAALWYYLSIRWVDNNSSWQ
jgi:hypothetical protein